MTDRWWHHLLISVIIDHHFPMRMAFVKSSGFQFSTGGIVFQRRRRSHSCSSSHLAERDVELHQIERKRKKVKVKVNMCRKIFHYSKWLPQSYHLISFENFWQATLFLNFWQRDRVLISFRHPNLSWTEARIRLQHILYPESFSLESKFTICQSHLTTVETQPQLAWFPMFRFTSFTLNPSCLWRLLWLYRNIFSCEMKNEREFVNFLIATFLKTNFAGHWTSE